MSETLPAAPGGTLSTSPPATEAGGRLVSLDAFRGAIMLLMASSGFGLAQMAPKFPDSKVWQFLGFHTSHATWVGGGAWDMIQPAFMFMVGVALPFSLARRRAAGAPFSRQFGRAVWRSLVLVALGVFLASQGKPQTNFIFPNVLAQIGLGYTVAFLLVGRGLKVQLGAAAFILVGYWLAFALYPVAGPDVDLKSFGIPPEEAGEVLLPGFFAHWNKNLNFAAGFDRWFLNLFPHEKEFVFNAGGYQTLNFVPSIATAIFGIVAGETLRSERPSGERLRWLWLFGAVCLALGLIAGWTVCPIVKRIWTPSWALYSGGIVVWLLAAFYWIVDVRGWRAWAFPFVVVGMNSIAIYLMHSLLAGWIVSTLRTHLGKDVFSGTYGPMVQRVSVLLVLWLACWWMYRRRVFLRV